jgi:hypothetical protein
MLAAIFHLNIHVLAGPETVFVDQIVYRREKAFEIIRERSTKMRTYQQCFNPSVHTWPSPFHVDGTPLYR